MVPDFVEDLRFLQLQLVGARQIWIKVLLLVVHFQGKFVIGLRVK